MSAPNESPFLTTYCPWIAFDIPQSSEYDRAYCNRIWNMFSLDLEFEKLDEKFDIATWMHYAPFPL